VKGEGETTSGGVSNDWDHPVFRGGPRETGVYTLSKGQKKKENRGAEYLFARSEEIQGF